MSKIINQFAVLIILLLLVSLTLMKPRQLECSINTPEQFSEKGAIKTLHIPFVENKGQVQDKSVLYYSRTFGGPVFITNKGEIVYCFFKRGESDDPSVIVIKERFGDEKPINLQAVKLNQVKVSYLKGKNASKWMKNLNSYDAINCGEISSGVELIIRSTPKNIEKIFQIKPGIDPNKISVSIEGANELIVSSKGELLVNTDKGIVRFSKPVAYQKINGVQSFVDIKYAAKHCEYGFKLGHYDTKYKLFIDPLLSSTFIGGGANDIGRAVCTDIDGNVFVIGSTESVDFPSTPGVYKTSNSGIKDIYISKFDSNLETLIAATYLGGSEEDEGLGIAVDNNGDIIIAGVSTSDDFPITPGTYTPNPVGGGTKIFVAKFDNDLQNLLASAYLGAVNSWQKEYLDVLAVNNNGDMIVVGLDPLSGFSTDTSIEHYWIGYSGFVAKLSSSLSTLLSAIILNYPVNSVSIDSKENILIGGSAQGQNNTEDVYVAKYDPDLQTQLGEMIFGGGNGYDYATSLAIDNSDNIYVAGNTSSSDFPVTPGVFDETYNDDGDMFFTKIDSNLTGVQIATFLGTENTVGSEGINSIRFNGDGDLCGAGFTSTDNWPVTKNAPRKEGGGHSWGFVVKFDSNLENLLYSTYLGGSDHDYVNSLSVANGGYVYVAGETRSSDFPVTESAYDKIYNLEADAFISKLNPETSTLYDRDGSNGSNGSDNTGGGGGSGCFISSISR